MSNKLSELSGKAMAAFALVSGYISTAKAGFSGSPAVMAAAHDRAMDAAACVANATNATAANLCDPMYTNIARSDTALNAFTMNASTFLHTLPEPVKIILSVAAAAAIVVTVYHIDKSINAAVAKPPKP